MNADTLNRYLKYRADHPFMRAADALAIVKSPDHSAEWEEGRRDGTWTREHEGFSLVLTIEDESIYPRPDKHGVTDYGRYVDEARDDWRGEWQGNYPAPAERAPLGLPYTSIRYSGPGWVQGETPGYFIPDSIEEDYADYRRRGQSKSVAWDLTRANVEAQLSMLFSSPLTYCDVRVTASRAGVELGSASMGADVGGDEEGRAYLFSMVEEYDMIGEAIEQAREAIRQLVA